MELDKKAPLEHKISKEQEKSIEDRFIIKDNKFLDMFHPDFENEAVRRFNNFISKGINNSLYKDGSSNRGIDRVKSDNHFFDEIEKRLDILEPPVGKIFRLEDYGIQVNKTLTSLETCSYEIYKEINMSEIVICDKEGTVEKKISIYHRFLNWITRSGKWEQKFLKKLFNEK